MRFSSLSLAVALSAVPPAAFAAPSVATCPGGNETFSYFYQYCINGTHVGEVSGECHGNGTKIEEMDTVLCSDWALAGSNVTDCVLCAGIRAVCTNDNTNPLQVCAAAASKTCNSGLNWEADHYPCVDSNEYQYTVDFCVDGVLNTTDFGNENCNDDDPSTPYCNLCGGVGICAGVNDTCARVLEGVTSGAGVACPVGLGFVGAGLVTISVLLLGI